MSASRAQVDERFHRRESAGPDHEGLNVHFRDDDDLMAETTASLISSLNHPVRRAIFRFLLKGAPASSSETAKAISVFGLTVNLVNFHLDILLKKGAATRRRNADNNYVYSLTDHARTPWVQTVLQLTATED